jgi:integrase
MKKPSGGTARERALSDAEIKKVWNDLPQTLVKSKTCQRIIKLCLLTVQRVGEVAGMEVAELDLNAGAWTIPGRRTKNKQTHIVPLSMPAIVLIREALTEAGKDARFVFPNKAGGAGYSNMAVAKTIAGAQNRFGLAHWTAHDLRRTALTNFAFLGVAPVVAGAVANHTTVTKATITLKVYTRYSYEAEKRAALEIWADRLMAIVTLPAIDHLREASR